ncbi:MAG: hypothetical protein EOP05_21945, partial [Proteobacteria bacterium]
MIVRFFKAAPWVKVGLLVASLCVTPLVSEAAAGKVSRESSGVDEVFKAPRLLAQNSIPEGKLLAQAEG